MSVHTDPAAATGLRACKILPFPPRHEPQQDAAARLGPAITNRWQDHHLPVIAAAVDLLDLDDSAFAARLSGMRDREGTTLVLELVDAIEETSGAVDLVFRSLFLVRSRLKTGLSNIAAHGEQP